jgi:hypothetical protein
MNCDTQFISLSIWQGTNEVSKDDFRGCGDTQDIKLQSNNCWQGEC